MPSLSPSPTDACWFCRRPRRTFRAWQYIAGLGVECDDCRRRIDAPITELEQMVYAQFHRRAALARPEMQRQLDSMAREVAAAGGHTDDAAVEAIRQGLVRTVEAVR